MTEGEPTRRKEEVFGKEKELAEKIIKDSGLLSGKISRRDFLKILVAGGISIATGLALWERSQKRKETTAEETTPEIEKTAAEIEKEPEGKKEFDIEKESLIESLEELSKYPEAIKKRKGVMRLDNFGEYLSKQQNFRTLIIGEVGGSAYAVSTQLLKKLKKSGIEISVIGVDTLQYTDLEYTGGPGDIPGTIAVKNKQLRHFAKENSIPIVGLEEGLESPIIDPVRKNLGRNKKISEKASEIIEKYKGKNGIAVFSVNKERATFDTWEWENLMLKLSGETFNNPSREEVIKNKYTLAESLGEGAKILVIEDWALYAKKLRHALLLNFKDSPFSERGRVERLWKEFDLETASEFAIPHPKGGANTYLGITRSSAISKFISPLV